jgi:uncharacterized protein (TIGR00375 family)
MIVNADLHIHSHYTKPRQPRLDFATLATNARLKGLDIVATGDCLHPRWLKHIEDLSRDDDVTYSYNDIHFILSTELQTNDNVHHLLYFPDLTSVYDFRDAIHHRSENIETDGKAIINVTSETIAGYAKDVDALIGPAHIFDKSSGIYEHYSSLKECYGDNATSIHFAELGLGGDTYYADTIKELHRVTFLTSSDTHNPHPIRLGREFTRFQLKKPTFSCIKKAILRKDGNYPVLNVGVPPEEGKYFESACTRCYKRFSIQDASKRHWKCTCGAPIKKGVQQRINENATFNRPQHPYHRPLYLSILPLHEIITKTLQQQNPFTDTVMRYWHQLISTFGDEITVLLDTPVEDIAQVAIPSITEAIYAFREANIFFNPGGGGLYGSITFPWEENELIISLKS